MTFSRTFFSYSAQTKLRAKVAMEIDNEKANTFAFQLLTSARISENRVTSRMTSLFSRDGVDSIITKVFSISGCSGSISSWVSSSFSWTAKHKYWPTVKYGYFNFLIFYKISLFVKIITERQKTFYNLTFRREFRAEKLHRTRLEGGRVGWGKRGVQILGKFMRVEGG